MLLDGSFIGKAAGKFWSRGVCILKMHFHRNKVFNRNVTSVQYFEGNKGTQSNTPCFAVTPLKVSFKKHKIP